MVLAQHGAFTFEPLTNWDTNLASADFPGTGEDEIAFQRGETIVVIAKDDGFGDGWWTVFPLLGHYPSPASVCICICALIVFHHIVKLGGGGVGRWAPLSFAHVFLLQRLCHGCITAIGGRWSRLLGCAVGSLFVS
jgi:SH3 domain